MQILNNKKKSILSVIEILRDYVKQITNFCRVNEIAKMTISLHSKDLKICNDFIKKFCNILDDNKQVLSDTKTCPLFIVIVGLWSSFYKKELKYSRIFGKSSSQTLTAKIVRLFLEENIKEMLIRNVDPNIIHNHIHGSTAMHWIIAWDRSFAGVDLLRLIKQIQGNFNPDILDSYNRSSLSLLIARKYFGRVKKYEIYDNQLIVDLLSFNPDIAIKDSLGNTALHYACLKRDIFSVDALILKNPDINPWQINNDDNVTPLNMCYVSYEEASLILKKVYVASTSEHIFNKNRWSSSKEVFLNHVENLSKLHH